MSPALNPGQAIAKTALNVKTALAPLLYGPDDRPIAGADNPFTGRELPPGAPLRPSLPPGAEPRQWFPWAGYNLAFTPRGETGDLTPFQILRNLASICDPVKNAMGDVKGEVLGFGWDVRAKEDQSLARTSEIASVKEWLKRPDGHHDFQAWLAMLMDEVLVIDALSLYRRRSMDGTPHSLVILDGSTIKPLVDYHGIPPAPPFPAYQQVGFGRVESEFTLPWHTPDPFQPDGLAKAELVYKPMFPRTWTPYGEGPIERLIPTINLYVRRYLHYLGFYTEGNIPEAFWKCPDTWTPEQIDSAQQILDQLLVGNAKLRSRLRLMAGGEGTGLENPRGHDTWSREFDEALKRDIYAAFNASPLPVVQMMNRATGEQADAAESDSGTKVRKLFIAGIINQEIEEFLAFQGVEFIWKEEKQADERLQLEKNAKYVELGIFTEDEVREDEGKKPLTDEQRASMEPATPPPPDGQVPPDDNAPPKDGKDAPVTERLAIPGMTRAAQEDLRRWKKVALKDVEKGRARRAFETTAIPSAVRLALSEWLQHASSREDVLWGFHVLVRARRPLLQARKRIRLERSLRAEALAHFKDRAPEIAALALRYYEEPAQERAAGDESGGGQPPDDEIDKAMQWEVFQGKVEPRLADAFAEGGTIAEQQIPGEGVSFGLLDEAATAYAEERAAEMVGMRRLEDGTLVKNPNAEWAVSKTVRDRIHDVVAKATKEGWTGKQLAAELESGDIWSTRADMIARTEVAMAVNQGAAETYRAAGVETVTILDGPGCLEDGHDDAQRGVNGEVWTLAKFNEFPVGHPHCRRDGAPNVEEAQEAA